MRRLHKARKRLLQLRPPGRGEHFKTEEAARDDYRKIAERRVRLGLVLAEMGQKANITVSDDELTQALVARASCA